MLLLPTWMPVSEHEHDVLVSVIIGLDFPFYVIIGLDPIIQVKQTFLIVIIGLDPIIQVKQPFSLSYSGLTGVSR